MGDIIIRYISMPASIRAYTLTDHNDDYNVYVNDEQGAEMKRRWALVDGVPVLVLQ